jgi:hypothetical protein
MSSPDSPSTPKKGRTLTFADRATSSRHGTKYMVDFNNYKQVLKRTRKWIGMHNPAEGEENDRIVSRMRSPSTSYMYDANYIDNYDQARIDLKREYEENAKKLRNEQFSRYAMGAGLIVTLAILLRCSGMIGGRKRKANNKTHKRKNGGNGHHVVDEEKIMEILETPEIQNILRNDECPNDRKTKREVNELIKMLLDKLQSKESIHSVRSTGSRKSPTGSRKSSKSRKSVSDTIKE